VANYGKLGKGTSSRDQAHHRATRDEGLDAGFKRASAPLRRGPVQRWEFDSQESRIEKGYEEYA